jgi:archaellum component FlaC
MADPKITVEIGAVADGLIKNVDGSIRSLEQLQRELDDLDNKLRTSADPTEIVQLNQQIGALKAGMQSLRTAGLDPLTKAQSSYNSVGIDFARIIQDAPFGIIGVSNNITQLATSFQNARNSGQSFTKILGSVFSSGNLLTLGISAITTALVLYEQSTQGAVKETDLLKDSYDDLADSAENASKKISAIRFADDKIKEEIDRILELDSSFSFVTASAQQLTEITNRAFAKLDREQLNAFKSSLNELADDQLRKVGNELGLTRIEVINFINSLKGNDDAFESLNPKVRDAVSSYNRLSNQVTLASDQLEFYKNSTDKTKESTTKLKVQVDDLKRSFEVLSNLPKIGLPGENLEDLARRLRARRQQLQEGGRVDPNSLQNAIANAPGISTTLPIKETATIFTEQATIINSTIDQLSSAFSSLGTQIASSLNIGNDALKGFVITLLSNAPKIIQAILAQAAAKKAASASEIATNSKVAASEGIASAAKAANALGPVGLALLPVFIGGALAIIGGAFRKTGSSFSGGGGGSFSGASGIGTTFSGQGATGLQFDRSLQLSGEFRVKGQDLVYVFNEASTKNQRG